MDSMQLYGFHCIQLIHCLDNGFRMKVGVFVIAAGEIYGFYHSSVLPGTLNLKCLGYWWSFNRNLNKKRRHCVHSASAYINKLQSAFILAPWRRCSRSIFQIGCWNTTQAIDGYSCYISRSLETQLILWIANFL